MTQSDFAAVLGAVMSLIFTFLPVVKEWFETKDSAVKAQIVAVLSVLIGLGVAGLSCANLLVTVECTQNGIVEFVKTTLVNSILGLTASQALHSVTKNFKKAEGLG